MKEKQEYNIKVYNKHSRNFKKICDYVEKNINRENLRSNGGILNYRDLTYYSDVLIIAFNKDIPIGYNSLVICDYGYYVYQIAVKEEYKHKGVGSCMLQKAIDIAKEEDKDICAHAMNYNDNSLKLFNKMGFIDTDPNLENRFLYLNIKELINNKKR